MTQMRTKMGKVWMGASAPMLLALLTGCSSLGPNPAQYDSAMAAPLPPDRARVCFVRQSAMLGAIVPHSVFDCGSTNSCDVALIETSRWLPASPQRMQEFFTADEALGTFLLEHAAGRKLFQNKPVFFTIGDTPTASAPNTDLMDAAYLAMPPDTLRATGLARTPIVTGGDYLWAVSDPPGHPALFFRAPGRGRGYTIKSGVKFKQLTGPQAVELMAAETGKNARYLGTVRSGGMTTWDRPAGTMRLRVVTPGGDTAFAPDFTVEAGKKYVILYTYGFSGVDFALSERP